jgi:outer membrane receptor protein involved in Fe transport
MLAVMASAQTTTTPAKEDEKVVNLEKFEVTGSRIKRLDAETVSPVEKVTLQDMQLQGFTTLGDAIRAMPQNSGQALTPTDSGTSFTPNISTVNLRGLGNNQTLVLINGRRGVPYAAPGFNGFQTMFDLNSIPTEAIESMEILKDGGSALYGSDAVAGVLNVKLRRDFQGLSTSAEVGNYFKTDGMYRKASAVLGTSNAKTSIVAVVGWEETNAVFSRDFPLSANVNRRSLTNAYYTVDGWAAAGFASQAAYLTDAELTNPVSDGYLTGDVRSSRGYPGRVTAVVNGKSGTYTFTTPTSTPTLATAVKGSNLYNYAEATGLFPENRRYSMYTMAKHDFSSSLYLKTELSFNRTEAQVYSAATPVDIETSHGLNSADPMFIPSYNPYNPFNQNIYTGRRRMVENGARISDVTSDTPRLLVALGGTIEDFGTFTNWSWEAGAMYTKNSVNTINRGTLPDYRLQEALMGLTRLGDGSLSWNPATPQANRVYFNWFGLNEPAMAKFLEVENPNSAYLSYANYDFNASGQVFQLPAGPLTLSIGAEHRHEVFGNVKSDLNATGNILGGSEGTSSFGNRRVTSIFAETGIPLLKGIPGVQMLEAQIAGRFEDYSDKGFAKQARPKLGLKWKPLEWLIIRGSFSKSFKAPDLAYLYTASQTSFSSTKVYDPVTKTQVDQIQIVTAGNTQLKPELTDTYYAGFAIEPPKGMFKGLSVTVDAFKFKQTQLLSQLSDIYGYADFLTGAQQGNPLFADKVVRSATTNELLFIRDDYVNVSNGEYKGMDFGISYELKTSNLGRFHFSTNSTWISELSYDGSNSVGSRLVPRWRATGGVNWTKGDYGANLFGQFIARRHVNVGLGSGYDKGDYIYASYDVASQFVMNASVSYKGFHQVEISAGVNNVFDNAGPFDPQDSGYGTTAGVNIVRPVNWFVRVEHKF